MTSCFFCQNLLSDYMEQLLPASRQEEVRAHVESCSECSEIHRNLALAVKALRALPMTQLSHDTCVQSVEACVSTNSPWFEARRVSRSVLASTSLLLILGAWVVFFPSTIPFLNHWWSPEMESQFVRYYPLHQGASEIIEEQAAWLHSRESIMGSLWEEGGLSPDEFENAFQFKSQKSNLNQ